MADSAGSSIHRRGLALCATLAAPAGTDVQLFISSFDRISQPIVAVLGIENPGLQANRVTGAALMQDMLKGRPSLDSSWSGWRRMVVCAERH